jgi:hypothetical protein
VAVLYIGRTVPKGYYEDAKNGTMKSFFYEITRNPIKAVKKGGTRSTRGK